MIIFRVFDILPIPKEAVESGHQDEKVAIHEIHSHLVHVKRVSTHAWNNDFVRHTSISAVISDVNPGFGIKKARWTMLTVTLSKLIAKTESMRMRWSLGNFIRYRIRAGNETKMTSETTSAVQDLVNRSYMTLESRRITRKLNHSYRNTKRALETWDVIPRPVRTASIGFGSSAQRP